MKIKRNAQDSAVGVHNAFSKADKSVHTRFKEGKTLVCVCGGGGGVFV
jgi:hypothetical protein